MFPRVSTYNTSAVDAGLPGAEVYRMHNAAFLFDMILWEELQSAVQNKK